MKKTLLLLCLAAGLLSCAKELINPQEENAQNEGVPMQLGYCGTGEAFSVLLSVSQVMP